MPNKVVGGLVIACVAVTVTAAAREASAQEPPDAAIHMSAKELPWAPLTPDSGLQWVPLWGDHSKPDEDGYGMLLMVPAGAEAGVHAHSDHRHVINMQGTLVRMMEGDAAPEALPPGSYVYQPGGQFHNERCEGPEDCVLFIHQHGHPPGAADMLRPHAGP